MQRITKAYQRAQMATRYLNYDPDIRSKVEAIDAFCWVLTKLSVTTVESIELLRINRFEFIAEWWYNKKVG